MIGVLIVAVILVRPGGILGEERRVAQALRTRTSHPTGGKLTKVTAPAGRGCDVRSENTWIRESRTCRWTEFPRP